MQPNQLSVALAVLAGGALAACERSESSENGLPADAGPTIQCGALEEPGATGTTALCVAKSVAVVLPDGSPGYTIDATEVTASQYAAWLATGPVSPPVEPYGFCASKTGYNAGSHEGDEPVGTVDWCDAYAYCSGVGKRLCGAIGGGSLDLDASADATRSQWFNACSSGGRHDYPYGTSPMDAGTAAYQPGVCDDATQALADSGSILDGPLPAGSLPGCQSSEPGYTGVYDLSGSVMEWEDSCDPGASLPSCGVRGGSWLLGSSEASIAQLACSSRSPAAAQGGPLAQNHGFRCCGI